MRNQYNFNPYPNYTMDSKENTTCTDRNLMTMNFTTNMNQPQMNPNINDNMENNSLATPEEAYTRGNLFNNLYVPYKNYRPMRLIPNNQQAEMLLQVNQLLFASHELRLYLDNFPDDRAMISLFNQYRSRANQLTRAYEQQYGPMNWEALSTPNQFSWEKTPWPWEMEEM